MTQGDQGAGHLSVGQGAALSIGAVLGTGVLTLPALAAAIAGPASLLSWLALILLSLPMAGTFAALGARYPDAGGVSTYVRRAFGGRAAAMVGWCFYTAVPAAAPAAAMMAGRYVADALGGGRVTELATTAVLIGVVWALNAAGLRLSGRVQLALAAVLAALMVLTVVVAIPHARPDAVGPLLPHGWGSVASAAGLLVWAFAGWEAMSSLAAEYRDPARAVPRATAIALVTVGVLYLALAATTILVLGAAAGDSAAPLSDLMALSIGPAARPATALVAVLLTVGTMNTFFAGAAKLGAALARDGALPAWFAAGSNAGQVPRRSLLIVGGGGLLSLAVCAATGQDLTTIMLLATSSFTTVYLLGSAAAVRLLPPGWARRGAAVAAAASVALAVSIGLPMLWPVGVSALAALYLALRRPSRGAGSEAGARDGEPDAEPGVV
ncbi:MAG: APC family permease [Micropruina sp.]|uniref:APC family permease n=1 Tax=Micropruina sp. TaxID=2737536 RepID=UPI0039E54C5C